jgi:hypothetical protein
MKKAQSFTWQFAAMILALLVIAAILMYLYKPSIIDWIKNLPDYTTPGDREINITPDQTGGNIDYVAQINGEYVYVEQSNGKYLKTMLLWKADQVSGKLMLYGWPNKHIGDVNAGVLTIISSAYSYVGSGVSAEDLKKIDGSKFCPTNRLCKTKGT